MRVLVTRAEPAASRTANRLRTLGHEPIVVPLAQAVHDLRAARDALSQPHRALAITSAEVTRVLAELGSNFKAGDQVPLFAVGDATARAAREVGFENVVAGAGNGSALADLIASRLAGDVSEGCPLLYMTGTPRSRGLEARLDDLRIPYRVCECYRIDTLEPTQPELQHAFGEKPVDAVVLYSAESARRLLALARLQGDGAAMAKMRFFCMSQSVADVLPSTYGGRTFVAANPDEPSLLRLLSSTV